MTKAWFVIGVSLLAVALIFILSVLVIVFSSNISSPQRLSGSQAGDALVIEDGFEPVKFDVMSGDFVSSSDNPSRFQVVSSGSGGSGGGSGGSSRKRGTSKSSSSSTTNLPQTNPIINTGGSVNVFVDLVDEWDDALEVLRGEGCLVVKVDSQDNVCVYNEALKEFNVCTGFAVEERFENPECVEFEE